jgi:hypothetical protein
MAKNDENKDADGAARQRERMGRGEQLESGWCYNGDRNPDVFRCSEEDEAVARGDISVSYDGRTVTDLTKGEAVVRDQPDEYKVAVPQTLAETAEAGGARSGGDAGVPSASATATTTTDNAGGGGGRASRGGNVATNAGRS